MRRSLWPKPPTCNGSPKSFEAAWPRIEGHTSAPHRLRSSFLPRRVVRTTLVHVAHRADSAGIERRVRQVAGALAPWLLEAPDRIADLCTWLALVRTWNARIDLTSVTDLDPLVDLFLADALVLASHAGRFGPSGAGERAITVVDVGTGAGAPGLGMALARPSLLVTLVEPLQKRVAFLRTVLGTVGRADVVVRRDRLESLAQRCSFFDVAVSRATLAPAEWLAAATRLVPAHGEVWVLLAREEPPVCAGWRALDDVRYELPLTGSPRRALGYVPQEAAQEASEKPAGEQSHES